jgi:hypothetical protein
MAKYHARPSAQYRYEHYDPASMSSHCCVERSLA